MSQTIQKIKDLAELANAFISEQNQVNTIDAVAEKIISAYKNGNKTMFCGNGGSSAEAQHLAAELSGKFMLDRPPIEAEACHVNSSFVTAVSNDYDFSEVYSRYIEASGKEGDVLVGLSTSGNSENILKAFEMAKSKNMHTVALTGKSGGKLSDISDFIIKVPSESVPRIQEMHLLIGHIICEKVEKALFNHEFEAKK